MISRQVDDDGTRPSEQVEWLNELVERWTEVYKKSATSQVLLELTERLGPVAAKQLHDAYVDHTGWSVTERGLYRTLQRLSDDGLLSATGVDAARTGAKRNEFIVTPLGQRFLARIREQIVATS